MTPQEEQSTEAALRDDAIMLAAIGVLAYAASMMTHEALGHGGYCLAVGGHNTLLTPWREGCYFPFRPPLGIKAAGPGVQFCAGLLSWLAVRLSSARAVRLRYWLWLYMAFNLFISSSYVAFSGLTGFGDAAELTTGHQPRFAWRGGLILIGSVVYYLSMKAAAWELKRFSGPDDKESRLYRLVWIPYASAGVFACCVACITQTFNQTAFQAGGWGATIALAALSSFASGAGLFGLPEMHRKRALGLPSQTLYVRWSAWWGLAAAAGVLAFLFAIGPGIK